MILPMAKVQGEAIRGHLDLLVLAALQSEPGHGYGVIARLRAESNGALDLPEGTIYPALHRLENARFLSSNWDDGRGPRRRMYTLTKRGETELTKKRGEWEALVQAVSAITDPQAPLGSAG
jgi:PadR family transcriptional regulator, regulatory protein PadR